MPICRICNIDKPEGEFRLAKKNLRHDCRACERMAGRLRMQNYSPEQWERFRQKQKDYRKTVAGKSMVVRSNKNIVKRRIDNLEDLYIKSVLLKMGIRARLADTAPDLIKAVKAQIAVKRLLRNKKQSICQEQKSR